MEIGPFYVKDCALICRMAGVHPAVSLRELRARVEVCPTASLYHHFCETKVRPSFDDPEYQSDFAVWAARSLRDQALAERLGVINPYDYDDLEDLRAVVLDVLDDHLAGVPINPQAQRGDHFHFMQAMTVVFDTRVQIQTVPGLLPAITKMTPGSIYFHVIEARRRTPRGHDDFSTWLLPQGGAAAEIAQEMSLIDFYFLSLRELQERLVTLLKSHFPTSMAV
ncbi:MAG TPA: DUF5752 family protein [Acidobacteriota bacterium]|nr:DUF5752 family protein [Acidobacteriota bacterium]